MLLKPPLLEVRNLSHFYKKSFSSKKHYILHDISFSLDYSSTLALMGASGSGKSTLAKAIAGIIKSDSIILEGKKVVLNNLCQRRVFYKDVQILFQDVVSSLNPRLNVFENLKEPLIYLLGIKNKTTQYEMMESVLSQLGLRSEILHSYPPMLSGGEAQRICIASALLIKPKILILDESTSGFDYELQERVWNVLLELQKQNACSFIFITHDRNLAKRFCKEYLIMREGRIIPA